MRNFKLLKKQDKKRLIAVCPIKNEKCFNVACGSGCAELKIEDKK